MNPFKVFSLALKKFLAMLVRVGPPLPKLPNPRAKPETPLASGTSFTGHPLGANRPFLLHYVRDDGMPATQTVMTDSNGVWLRMSRTDKNETWLHAFPPGQGSLWLRSLNANKQAQWVNIAQHVPVTLSVIMGASMANLYNQMAKKFFNA